MHAHRLRGVPLVRWFCFFSLLGLPTIVSLMHVLLRLVCPIDKAPQCVCACLDTCCGSPDLQFALSHHHHHHHSHAHPHRHRNFHHPPPAQYPPMPDTVPVSNAELVAPHFVVRFAPFAAETAKPGKCVPRMTVAALLGVACLSEVERRWTRLVVCLQDARPPWSKSKLDVPKDFKGIDPNRF